MQYLFNSSGNWIAFRQGKFVYDVEGNWIGWLPWDEETVVDTSGDYLGTVFPANRFYRRTNQSYLGYPGYPGFAGFSPLPPMTEDIPQLIAR